ncbi:hypothetical protein B0F90DRAFT_1719931 [Multifurca ochricompacta]|uniref:Protein kinase domain-containing protein n=1 Tax=Multifurca ochricompacta TaxID=376703 RepID=A0AAD4M3Z2_9AGAM|nr:hypothetical protein B0F90DRAFT_1719931 [Multifurca ochricompacta]
MSKVQKNPVGRIANDRPDMDSGLPPISLSYHGFGCFRAHMDGDSTGPMPTDKAMFEAAVDRFLHDMSRFYDSEKDRAEIAQRSLDEIWRCYSQEQEYQKIEAQGIRDDRSSDGHAIGPTNTVEIIIQVKNELGTTSCDGSVEMAAYYTQCLHLNTSTMSRRCFLFPALGILLMGAHIGFYALSFTKATRLVPLTPLLPAAIESGNEWARPALMRAFEAACILRYHINKDGMDYMAKRLAHPPRGDRPYINEVPTHPPSSKKLRFEINEELYQGKVNRYENRFIYGAITSKRKDKVVVKFTQRYCLALHLFCAEEGHAPRVRGYGVLHGRWHVIVMDRIEHDAFDRQKLASEYLLKWSKDLKDLVNKFHAAGFVHGDLRDANLIVPKNNPKDIMLVDFDWGGDLKTGEVYYPTACLNRDLVLGENANDLRITEARDNMSLNNTLRKLEAGKNIRMDED